MNRLSEVGRMVVKAGGVVIVAYQPVQRPDDDPDVVGAEWATPALFLAGPPLPLYRRADGVAPVLPRPQTAPALGGMIRRVGDFVGRLAELRSLLRELRGERPGVVLHGIGGAGKSSLAAHLINQLGEAAGLAMSLVGHTRVDLIVEAIRQRLHAHCLRAGPANPRAGKCWQARSLPRIGHTPLPLRTFVELPTRCQKMDRRQTG